MLWKHELAWKLAAAQEGCAPWACCAKTGGKLMKSVKEKWRTSTRSQRGKHQPVPSKASSAPRLVPPRAKIEPLVVKIAPIFLLNTTKAQQMCRKHTYSREEKSDPGLSNAAVTEESSLFFFPSLSSKHIEFSPPPHPTPPPLYRCKYTDESEKKKQVSRAQQRK